MLDYYSQLLEFEIILKSLFQETTEIIVLVDSSCKICYISRDVENEGYSVLSILGEKFSCSDTSKIYSVELPELNMIAYGFLKTELPSFHDGLVKKQFNSTIFNCFDNGYCECDRNGVILFANNSMLSMLDIGYSEIINTSIFNYIDEAVIDSIKKCLSSAIENRNGIHNTEILFKNRKGKIVRTESVIITLDDISGNVSRVRIVLKDLTSVNEIEEEINESRKYEAIAVFSGGIAHDYNNALTALLGNLELAKIEIDPGNDELRDILKDAEEASFKIKKLTSQLSNFSAGGKPSKRDFSVRDLVNKASESISRSFNRKISILFEDENIKINADEKQILHAVKSLLQNAIDATSDDGKVSIKVKNRTININSTNDGISPGDYIEISIQDDGTGIEDNIIDKIFNPYFTTKDNRNGMGLALVQAVVRRHRGFIELNRLPEETQFSICLPGDNTSEHNH